MPSRRAHTNSHHGCVGCKARRVKCDLAQPTCLRCAKRREECIYRHLSSAYDPFRHYNAAAGPSSAGAVAVDPSASPQRRPSSKPVAAPPCSCPSSSSQVANEESMVMLSLPRSPPGISGKGLDPVSHRLLHHFTTSMTADLVSSSAPFTTPPHFEVFRPFAQAVTRHVMSHKYIFHTAVAFSALHLALLSSSSSSSSASSRDYLVTALQHKQSAVSSFRSALSSLTPEPSSCDPAAAASGLLMGCAFALPLVNPAVTDKTQNYHDPVDLLAQIASLFQGSVAIFRYAWQHGNPGSGEGITADIAVGIIPTQDDEPALLTRTKGIVIVSPFQEDDWPDAERALQRVTVAIQSLPDHYNNNEQVIMGDRKAVLLDAAAKLRICLRRVAFARGNYHVSGLWLGMVTPGFITLLRRESRDPLAMVLLVHWVIVNKYLPHVWWTRGWAEWTVSAVHRELAGGGQYEYLLDWVLVEAGLCRR
ncbi:hypothetical protein QBC46DRAFT_364438 [Diplogelasinospora grovesii]|uniref:Zn(2)-C6 fungal-type domain-containing protein n=1 Tax=Diplogelasinospora grovesii TaxID=303347 RepID=A0AAN6N6C8_9PEZI|nr:hypothetical protein QBC46DRAFT_364438 [Diplogelasinospora grovesii]